ncbi:MAG: SpoIIE family protein phosphatase [Leptospira sp.]|nr:SpoIIE family protein phosphatase [Leptospira sp.]NCS93657.1 SpoIIE family protein phosphatase [Leptospira sp.]
MSSESRVCVLCGDTKTPEGETRKARFYCNTCGKEWILEKRRSTRFSGLLQIENQENRVSLLLDSLALFNSTVKIGELAFGFANFIHQRLGSRNVGILIIDVDKSQIHLAGYKSTNQKLERKIKKIKLDYDLSYGALVKSMTEARSIHYNLEDEPHPFYKLYADLTNTKSQLLIPILYGVNALGLITIDYGEPPDTDNILEEREMMELLTGQFAVALRNASLYERSKNQSVNFQNLHLSALTLSKLYIDNQEEMMRMVLLTASSFANTSQNKLYEKNKNETWCKFYELNRNESGMKSFSGRLNEKDTEEIFKNKEPQQFKNKLIIPFSSEDGTEFCLFLSKDESSFSRDDFEVLNAYTALTKITIDNTRMYKKMGDQKMIEREIEIARDIQLNLLPRETPEINGFNFSGYMKSAKGVGGDYYDFIVSPNESEVIICIGDVSGKGVSAGIVMATVRTILHSLVRRKPTINEILSDINTYIYYNYSEAVSPRFMTMTLISWDPNTNEFLFAGAGHGNILIYRKETNSLEIIETKGIVLGIEPNINRWSNSGTFRLNTGDVMLLYTDGVTEAMNENGVSFDDPRLFESFMKHASENLNSKNLLNQIYEDLEGFVGDREQHDDITMIALASNG